MRLLRRALLGAVAVGAAIALTACQDNRVPTGGTELSRGRLHRGGGVRTQEAPAVIEIFAPETDHLAGQNGVGWFVDLAVEF
jgi:hypothetical protein